MELAQESITFFKRKEKKFIIDSKTFFSLKRIFEDPSGKFSRDHLDLDTSFTFIENIYLDSPNLNSYHQSIKDDSNRFKLRIRSYAQDFQKKDDVVFLEIKSKELNETIKKRVVIKRAWLEGFLRNGTLPEGDFFSLNLDKKPKKSLEIINYIYSLIKNLGYQPVLSSSYIRYSYKLNGTKVLRITIDSDLNFHPLKRDLNILLPYTESILQNQFVVEIKYLNEENLLSIPVIMSLLGASNKFSKYNFGIYTSFLKMKENERIKFGNYPQHPPLAHFATS
jgi:hypothetical protein